MLDSSNKYNFLSAQFLIDRKLYKYYSNVRYAVDCIKNRRIHLDDPRAFNDPFDAVFSCPNISMLEATESERELILKFFEYISAIPPHKQSKNHHDILTTLGNLALYNLQLLSSEEGEKPIASVIRKFYALLNSNTFTLNEFTKAIDCGFVEKQRVMRLNCRISCFSEIKDSILMWSYYANSHNGVCIEFDLSRLDPNDELNNKILKSLTKVHYSPLRADVQHSGAFATELNFITSKADVWGHEHEWRIICETQEQYLPFDCVSGVYVGVNFNTNAAKYQELVKAVNTYENLPIMQCKLSIDKYQLEFEELYNSYINTYLKEQPLKNEKQLASNIA